MAKDQLLELNLAELKKCLKENFDTISKDIEEKSPCALCHQLNTIPFDKWRYFKNHKEDYIFKTLCKSCSKEVVRYKTKNNHKIILGDLLN